MNRDLLPSAVDPTVFDEAFLRQLERLMLVTRTAVHGGMKGVRRSVKRGQSVEFTDYRNYIARRRPARARLEPLRAAREAVHQAVHRGGGRQRPHPARCVGVDGRRHAGQAPLRQARRGRPGVRRPRLVRPRQHGRAPGSSRAALPARARHGRASSRCWPTCPASSRARADRPRRRVPPLRRAADPARTADADQRPVRRERGARDQRACRHALRSRRAAHAVAMTSSTRRSRATCAWSTARRAMRSTSPPICTRSTRTRLDWPRGRRASTRSPASAASRTCPRRPPCRWRPRFCRASAPARRGGLGPGKAISRVGFLAPLALIGLVSVPLIVAFYMLRLRRPERPVSSTYLWQQLVRDVEANAPWQRLRRSLLLLLQLLLAVAARLRRGAAVQRAPRRPGARPGAGHRRVRQHVVHRRISRPADRRQARRDSSRWRNVPSDGRVSVVAAGETARVVANEATDRGRIARAIESIEASTSASDLTDALKLAGELAERARGAEILVVTDDAGSTVPEVVARGAGARPDRRPRTRQPGHRRAGGACRPVRA